VLAVELELILRPDVVEEFLTVLAPQSLPDTRKWEGNEGLILYQDRRDPRRVSLLMRWRTLQDFDLYLDWRARTGFLAQLYQMCTEPLAWVFLEEKISI
jgi:quinol monooxygenase YgiN